MSDSTSNTKNNYNELEKDLVEDNPACLDHFFLEEDDSSKLTHGKTIGDRVQLNQWTLAFNACVWAVIKEQDKTIVLSIQSQEQL